MKQTHDELLAMIAEMKEKGETKFVFRKDGKKIARNLEFYYELYPIDNHYRFCFKAPIDSTDDFFSKAEFRIRVENGLDKDTIIAVQEFFSHLKLTPYESFSAIIETLIEEAFESISKIPGLRNPDLKITTDYQLVYGDATILISDTEKIPLNFQLRGGFINTLNIIFTCEVLSLFKQAYMRGKWKT